MVQIPVAFHPSIHRSHRMECPCRPFSLLVTALNPVQPLLFFFMSNGPFFSDYFSFNKALVIDRYVCGLSLPLLSLPFLNLSHPFFYLPFPHSIKTHNSQGSLFFFTFFYLCSTNLRRKKIPKFINLKDET